MTKDTGQTARKKRKRQRSRQRHQELVAERDYWIEESTFLE